MLQIYFSQLMSKRNVIVKESSLSLPIKKGVLLQGEQGVVTSVFTHILYQKQCQFSIDETPLDRDCLQDQIILLTPAGNLPLTKKVKSLFYELGYTQAECANLLREIDMDTKANRCISRLSKEERLLLSLQYAWAKHASLLLLDNDWTKVSASCQKNITKILQKHLASGKYVLLAQGAKHLLTCEETYEIVGQTICSKQEHIANFLEESGDIEKIQIKKLPFWQHIKSSFSFLRMCRNSIFTLLSILFVFLALILVLGFSLSMQRLDALIEKEKGKDTFYTKLLICSYGFHSDEYCNDASLTSEQKQMLQSIEGVEGLFPIHSLYMPSNGSTQETIQNEGLFADGEFVSHEGTNGLLGNVISAMDASMYHVEERFVSDEKTQMGIYISEDLMQSNQDVFDSVKGKEWSVRGTYNVPILTQTLNQNPYSQNVSGNAESETYRSSLSAPIQLNLPILGVVDDSRYSWYMDEQNFLEIQAKAKQTYEERNSLYEVDPNAIMEEYQPEDYEMLITSYEDIARIEGEVQRLDEKIRVINDVVSMQNNKLMFQDMETVMRDTLTPFLLVIALFLSVLIVWMIRIQKSQVLYDFQHQKITKQWNVRLLSKILLSCIVISSLSVLFLKVISSEWMRNIIMMQISNSSYFSSYNLYDYPIYRLFASLFQVFPMYSIPMRAIALTISFGCIVAVSRYLATLYWYYKCRKEV